GILCISYYEFNFLSGQVGYEFKWNARKAIQAPGGWKKNYPEAGFEVIHPGNYEAWLGYGNIV
ncbi:MAG TPA: hypothetical protein PKA00_22535, partial [Saprospiraceae bacterium]|nr:hypothetical protein [Saprospiraceae bacterium]